VQQNQTLYHIGGNGMKRDIPLWQFGGFALTSLGGTLLHFLYE
jgi:hypothetical protein